MIKQRLDKIIKEIGVSGRQFEKEVGLSNGSYSSITDGIGADKLKKIIFRYPQISLDYLITGEGEMLKYSTQGDCPEPAQSGQDNEALIAVIRDLQEDKKELKEEKRELKQEVQVLKKRIAALEKAQGEERRSIPDKDHRSTQVL